MTTREDVHAPRNMNPEDYEHLGSFYLGWNEDALESGVNDDAPFDEMFAQPWKDGRFYKSIKASDYDLERIKIYDGGYNLDGSKRFVTRTRTPHLTFDGFFIQRGGQCDHCGSRFKWGVAFTHKPTGDVVCVGHQCAREWFYLPNQAEVKKKKAEQLMVAAAKRRKLKKDINDFLVANPGVFFAMWAIKRNDFVASVTQKFFKYGSLSDRQVVGMLKTAANFIKWENEKAAKRAQEAAEAPNRKPCPEGKGVTITGEVVNVSYVENDYAYGEIAKMLVVSEDGFKVYGTVPEGLWNKCPDGMLKGCKISFVANIQPKRGDDFFGYFKRPRKYEVIS